MKNIIIIVALVYKIIIVQKILMNAGMCVLKTSTDVFLRRLITFMKVDETWYTIQRVCRGAGGTEIDLGHRLATAAPI